MFHSRFTTNTSGGIFIVHPQHLKEYFESVKLFNSQQRFSEGCVCFENRLLHYVHLAPRETLGLWVQRCGFRLKPETFRALNDIFGTSSSPTTTHCEKMQTQTQTFTTTDTYEHKHKQTKHTLRNKLPWFSRCWISEMDFIRSGFIL